MPRAAIASGLGADIARPIMALVWTGPAGLKAEALCIIPCAPWPPVMKALGVPAGSETIGGPADCGVKALVNRFSFGCGACGTRAGGGCGGLVTSGMVTI